MSLSSCQTDSSNRIDGKQWCWIPLKTLTTCNPSKFTKWSAKLTVVMVSFWWIQCIASDWHCPIHCRMFVMAAALRMYSVSMVITKLQAWVLSNCARWYCCWALPVHTTFGDFDQISVTAASYSFDWKWSVLSQVSSSFAWLLIVSTRSSGLRVLFTFL